MISDGLRRGPGSAFSWPVVASPPSRLRDVTFTNANWQAALRFIRMMGGSSATCFKYGSEGRPCARFGIFGPCGSPPPYASTTTAGRGGNGCNNARVTGSGDAVSHKPSIAADAASGPSADSPDGLAGRRMGISSLLHLKR